LEQYAVREEQFQHQLKAKDLNIQLLDAKLHHQIELTLQEGKKVCFILNDHTRFPILIPNVYRLKLHYRKQETPLAEKWNYR
jgi:hypothetical protein